MFFISVGYLLFHLLGFLFIPITNIRMRRRNSVKWANDERTLRSLLVILFLKRYPKDQSQRCAMPLRLCWDRNEHERHRHVTPRPLSPPTSLVPSGTRRRAGVVTRQCARFYSLVSLLLCGKAKGKALATCGPPSTETCLKKALDTSTGSTTV